MGFASLYPCCYAELLQESVTFMDHTRATLQAAHRHSIKHRKELERSEICGCFYCCRTFTAAAIEEWVAA
jgi:hypothetical protein